MADPNVPHPETVFDWPALEGADPEVLAGQKFERAIWGKAHDAPTDFRWLACSPSFSFQDRRLDRELGLGPEDAPKVTQLWRALGNGSGAGRRPHFAVSCYPSRAIDAVGRSGVLEKQILEWQRPPGVPAALGAVVLLPAVAGLDDEVWWSKRADPRWMEDDFIDKVEPWSPGAEAWTGDGIAGRVARGLEALRQRVTPEALAGLYAGVLARNRALSLGSLREPLPAEAVAALFLPLSRLEADRLSVAGWLPSTRADGAEQQGRWNLLLGGDAAIPAAGDPPTAEHQRLGERLAGALLAGDPSQLRARPRRRRPETADAGAADGTQLALWGPTASGKTVLLAQLYFEADAEAADWEIFPTESSLAFIKQMRDKMRSSNAFPGGTTAREKIVYHFRHRHSGAQATLEVEDRPGKDYQDLDEPTLDRLQAVDGLVLLFDPTRSVATRRRELWETLEDLHVASGLGGTKDSRPFAVCMSKADHLINSAADFRRARSDEEMDDFVRQHADPELLRALKRFCDNYRFFPVSSAGVDLRHGVIERVVFFDESLEPRICTAGQPFNLLAPFAWILDELTGGG